MKEIKVNNMKWKDEIRKNALDGSDMADDEYSYYYGDGSESEGYRNPPKGAKRLERVKSAWDKIEEAFDKIQSALSWTHPDDYQYFSRELRDLKKEIMGLKQEAFDHHGGKKDFPDN